MPDTKKSQSISLRLFLDGIESRIISATVSHTPQKPDTAQIKVPPHPVIEGIKEKTLVHIFYNDEEQSHEKDDITYKLLFEGQVTGSKTRLSQAGQNKTIMAQSMAAYLTQTKVNQTFLSAPNGFDINEVDLRQKVSGQDEIELADKTGSGGEIRSQIKQAMLNENNLTDAMHEMMRLIFEHNTFLQDVMRRMRILDRFPEINEEDQLAIDQFIKNENAEKLIQGAFGDAKSEYPVLNLINMITNIFHYSLNLNSGLLNTFNPTPNLINSPPPGCNILTPEDFSNISYSENHQAKPTRTALTLNSLGIQSAYIWPPELEQPLGLFDRDSLEDHQNFERLFTNEELTKGPRPHVTRAKRKVSKGEENEELERNYYMNKAQYNFDVARRRANNLTLSGRFNPEAFPGFTTFVVAPSVDVIFGLLSSVTHQIDNQNNTATTQYKVGMPYKLLTNPDNLAPPETNPALSINPSSDEPVPIDKLNNIYNDVLNASFQNNARGTWGEQGALTVTQEHVEKYFNGRFDSDRFKDNPVLKRAVVAMGQYLEENSYIGKSPGDRVVKEVEEGDTISEIATSVPYSVSQLMEASNLNDATNIAPGTQILSPDAAVGGQSFRRRGHPTIEMVFSDFYKSNKVNKGHTETNGDIWDFYNSENLDYITDDLNDERDKIAFRINNLQDDMNDLQEQLDNLNEEQELLEAPDASKETTRQDLESRIAAHERIINDLRDQVSSIDDQLEGINNSSDKPVLLKTEYEDYDLQGFLQRRQGIIISYNRELTKSDGGIVGNMNLFKNEILDDDSEDNEDGED